MAAAAVVHSERFARIDADSHLGCWIVGAFTGLGKYVDDELSDRNSFFDSRGLGIVWLSYYCMEALVVEVDKDSIHLLENAVYGTVMKVKKS